MADKNKSKEAPIPTPVQAEKDRVERTKEEIGFDDVLRYLALGITPTAPRIPEQALHYGSMFGGYPKGYTNRIGAKGTISFHTLRQVASRSPLLSAIVSKRLHQSTRYARLARKSKKGEVGCRVVHKRQHEKDFKVPEGFQNLIRECEEMLMKPWRVFWDEGRIFKEVEPSLSSFMSKAIDDLLVINRPVVELGLDVLRVPRAFGAIDGANIIPTFAAIKYLSSMNRDLPKGWEESYENYRRILQQVSDKYKIDVNERTEFIYLLSGRPVAAFRSDELIVSPQFPKSDVKLAGYPPSLTERALFIILAEILAMTANSRYFEYGSMAETIMTIKGNTKDEHVQELVNILKGNMSGVTGMHRVPVIATPGGKDDLEVVPIKNNHKDMLFDIYIQKLTNLACAVFSMHPSEINEAPRAGDNSGALNQASQTKQINMAQEQGLESALEHLKNAVFDPILERIDPDLEFEWDYGENESEQLAITNQYGTITTVNERRQMMGLEQISDEEGGNVIDNQFIQARRQEQQQAAQAQAQSEQQPPGAEQGGGGPQEGGEPEGEPSEPGSREQEDQGKGGKGKEEEKPDYANESPQDRILRIAKQRSRG